MKANRTSFLYLFLIGSSFFIFCPLFIDMDRVAKSCIFSFILFFIIIMFLDRAIRIAPVHVALLSLLFFLCVSSFFSYYPVSTLVCLSFLMVCLFFLIFTDFILVWSRLESFFLIVVLAVSILGIFEYFSFVVTGASRGMLIPYILPSNNSIRIAGFLGQPNLFALFLLVGIFVFIYQYLHNEKFSTCFLPKLRYLPLLTVAVVFFLTGSRAGLLALLLTYLPLCWLVARKRYLANDPIKRRQFIYLACVLLLAFGVSYALNYFSSLEEVRGISDTGFSTDARFVFWTSAILIFLDHPWLGVGLDNFKFYLPKYVNQAHDLLGFVQYEAMGYTKWAHNELLQLLCEGGIFVFLIVMFLLGLFFYQIYLYAAGHKQWTPLKLYSHLFLLPFIIQSMFSWPMRHPALLVLFFTFLGLLLSQYSDKTVIVPPWGRVVIRSVALCGLIITLLVVNQELKMGSLVHNMKRSDVQASFAEFEQLVTHPYSEYPLLLKVTPRYAYTALQDKDVKFAAQILPYVKKLVDLQGAHWQWYNLSLIYHLLEREDEAKKAVTMAIHVWPVDEKYWSFQHYLNMLDAAKRTGRPLEEFLPIPPDGSIDDIKNMLNFDDQIEVGM